MHNAQRWLASLLLLAAVVLSSLLTPPVRAQVTPTWLASIPSTDGPARTDGQTVVWFAGQEVMALRLSDRLPRRVATGPAHRQHIAVEDDLVVWSESTPRVPFLRAWSISIFAASLSTGAVTAVAQYDDLRTGDFALQNGRVIWWHLADDRPSDHLLQLRDLRGGGPVQTLYRRPWASDTQPSAVRWAGDHLLWTETVDQQPTPRWQLQALTPGAGAAPTLVAAGEGRIHQFDVTGDLAVLGTEQRVLLIRLSTGQQQTIIAGPANGLTTDGRQIFWGDRLSQVTTDWGRRSLHRYDAETGCYWSFEPAKAPSGAPHARHGAIIWLHQNEHVLELHGGLIDQLLADYPTIQVCQPLPQRRFFPATGQVLDTFREFWEQSGGLPVFGLPITPEQPERDAATGQLRLVQYFERQRLELHAELRRTPYAVQLGRLGAEAAQRGGLNGHPAFQPVPPTAPPRADCRYLAEVQHRLCGEFRQYWEQHGLELGDQGVTFRESLALFGYPLSEAFIDTDSGRRVQYFERAVFELHPDNPAAWRVLLARLGASRAPPR